RFLDRRRHDQAQSRREAQFAQLTPLAQDAPQDDALRLSQLRQAFLDLPDDQREALALIAVEGLSYAEAGQLLGIPP
ncbi:RNA polymerase sigma factor, partial [Paracoccus sp. S4493]